MAPVTLSQRAAVSRAASRACSSSKLAVSRPFAPAPSRASLGAAFLGGDASPLRSVSLRLRRAAPAPAFASNVVLAVTAPPPKPAAPAPPRGADMKALGYRRGVPHTPCSRPFHVSRYVAACSLE